MCHPKWRKNRKEVVFVMILITLIKLKLLSLPKAISLAFYLIYSNKGNGFLMNKIYDSNILHYFKLSKVKMKTKSVKSSKYFINNVSMHNNQPFSDC